MTYKITVHDSSSPDGQVISIYGLGAFKNGVARELSDDDERIFEEINGYTLEELNNPYVKIEKAKTKVKAKEVVETADEEGGAE